MNHVNTDAAAPAAGAGAAETSAAEASEATAPANGRQCAAPASGTLIPVAQAAPPPEPAAAPTMQRAEALADRLTVQAAVTVSLIGRGLMRFWARLREETADIWAEAQSIRRGDKSS
jgi:hypothetical protein